ncbi:splicing factor 3a, subunit 3 [Lophium mytilinum]|uniref:Splicing factor 3a, subunit 3 n=1 Tax=Lophium mytilinum TaxID=390894 RepID=A0A6A6QXP2_9PEZI|nr:splicing factor 3a, subunit 3 [Lophium mytilinum]
MSALEDERLLWEDMERLEQAIADRVLEDPKHIRERLTRDHQIAQFLVHFRNQAKRAQVLRKDKDRKLASDIQKYTTGDPFQAFNEELAGIKSFHRRYPNEPVEDLERAYKRGPDEKAAAIAELESRFTGEEGCGRFFDLVALHEHYVNLQGVKNIRRIPYVQYIDIFDKFTLPECTLRYNDKMTDDYFKYITSLAKYLESFMERTKPLEDLKKLFESFDKEFEEAWEKDQVPGWEQNVQTGSTALEDDATKDDLFCADCEKAFKNENVYNAHLTGKKHIKAAELRKARGSSKETSNGTSASSANSIHRLKERVIAEREFRVRKLAAAMSTERSDTRVNVERRQGMTDKERQLEIDAMYAETDDKAGGPGAVDGGDDEDEEGKIYNPLKLPLGWDGKPIPFWLYKLHGLGVEFPCEICGNYVYMGRRAFDKHFNEPRHIYGLKSLGVTTTTLFREITKIEEAILLWQKITQNKKQEAQAVENVVQMEDSQGNVMPARIYHNLAKHGLL